MTPLRLMPLPKLSGRRVGDGGHAAPPPPARSKLSLHNYLVERCVDGAAEERVRITSRRKALSTGAGAASGGGGRATSATRARPGAPGQVPRGPKAPNPPLAPPPNPPPNPPGPCPRSLPPEPAPLAPRARAPRLPVENAAARAPAARASAPRPVHDQPTLRSAQPALPRMLPRQRPRVVRVARPGPACALGLGGGLVELVRDGREGADLSHGEEGFVGQRTWATPRDRCPHIGPCRSTKGRVKNGGWRMDVGGGGVSGSVVRSPGWALTIMSVALEALAKTSRTPFFRARSRRASAVRP